MWLLLLLFTGAEVFAIAENTDEEIKDGNLSRKILGQSVVTSVSVVMDIGNGTKTIFTDPLGKPMDKPLSPSDLASPINLLNPDRYEFYTFDDNGNLVRRLMSLEEIKGIIATGDSDGLEYDSVLSESYIPEKRVNDVLSNVQNVLKEEMEIHSTKLDGFPVLDTPDVSDSWNMILPAVFGNSGADITPEKAPLHVTPDTIMIEPTEKSQSTPRSTPIFSTLSTTTKDQPISFEKVVTTTKDQPTTFEKIATTTKDQFTIFEKITSSNAITPSSSSINPIKWDQENDFNTESKESGITLDQATTKEYIPLNTVISQPITEKLTTNIEDETTVKLILPPVKTEYIKIEQVVSSTTPTIELVTSFVKINSTSEKSTETEATTTNLPELTKQSVESSINCTSVKNETDDTTLAPTYDFKPIDEVAATEILNQLLSTSFNDFNANITNSINDLLQENNTIFNETDKVTTQINNFDDRFETTPYVSEVTKYYNNSSNSTEEYSTTETIFPEINSQNTNIFKEIEKTSVIPTTASVMDSTIFTVFTLISNGTIDTFPLSENQTKPLSNETLVKSTKIENAIEDIDHKVKSTTENQDDLNATTILVPLILIDTSTITPIDLNEITIRIPLIDPSESKINTIKPSVGVFINESQYSTSVTSFTEIYEEIKNITAELTTKEYINMTQSSLVLTERVSPINTVQEIKTTESVPISKNNESNKKEPNWTLVPTIAPHGGVNLNIPPATSESYSDVLDLPELINLKAEPLSGFGLEESTASLDKDIYQFSQLYNELAFEFWKTTTNSLSHARSLVLSPFGTISLLAMIFLGARGSTSAEMNEILKLDDMITFNPHLVLKNVGESLMYEEKDSGVVTSAFIKELFMCRMKGKLLPFYKERVKAFYDGFAEEVNFAEIGDIIRRRTNLQVKKHSEGRIPEFLSDFTVNGRPPLLGLGVNIFQTDCTNTFEEGRDGEMHFTVLPTIRQRRLVPIPAVLYKSGFLAGYEPSLDATAVSIGGKNQTMSTIFIMPGQQGTPAPGDGLARLEKSLVESSFKKGSWPRLLRSLIPRSGLEVQIPKLIHRSVVNTTDALKKMGFTELFKKGVADLVGMNGISNDLYLSDMIQVNQFTTCGEKRTDHHSEMYPNSIGRSQRHLEEDISYDSFEDLLQESSYLNLPLPLRPRQARKPDTPRLKFDRPFLYFVRHNPTGLILHIGRFNPRLLP